MSPTVEESGRIKLPVEEPSPASYVYEWWSYRLVEDGWQAKGPDGEWSMLAAPEASEATVRVLLKKNHSVRY